MSELDVSDLLTVAEAIAIIDAAEVRPRVVTVPLGECLGLRLAEELRADRDDPAFEKSLMDGYAVRAVDVGKVPVELSVIGEVAAGTMSGRRVESGEAMAIMTGAPLPDGADAVVPVEYTRGGFVAAGGRVTVLKEGRVGQNVSGRGSNVKAGEVVLAVGMRMEGAQIGVAAAVGAIAAKVYDRASVAVLATGDELVDVGGRPGASQIRNGNSPMLVGLLTRMGCRVTDLGIAPDRPEKIRAAIEEGLRKDVIFITGGMSVGEHDHVPRILVEMGGKLKVTKLRIKPGKPFVFAEMPGGKFAVGLPGNPVSAFVCTVRLGGRLLARLSGGTATDGLRSAKLAGPLGANGPREFYQPAQIREDGVHPMTWKGSADIYTLAKADALIARAAADPAKGVGAEVFVMDI